MVQLKLHLPYCWLWPALLNQ